MFDSLTSKAITAAIGSNDGANNGFWRIQPRDDEGQWIEMGADVLFRFRTGDGNLVVVTSKGVYVGPSGRPGFARVLIKQGDDSGLTPGVYEVESRNLQQFKAIIPNVDSGSGEGSSRKDKFGRPVQTLEDAKLPTLKGLLEGATPATPEDERLARGELSPEETAAEADGRAKSPIADLPAGFEAENPEETKKLLRESGIEPDDFDSSAKKSAAPAQRGERPIAYGIRNLSEFRALPDGAILDEYERAQYYPNPDGYDGPFGPVLRQIIKQDGRWFKMGKSGKAVGKSLTREQVSASLRGGNLTDPGAASKLDENGNQVAVWADEVESSAPTPESRNPVNDAYVEAFEGGTPNLDNLIEKAKESESLGLPRQGARQKKPLDLEIGDAVLGQDGKRGVVLDIVLGDARNQTPARVRIQKEDGSVEVLTPGMNDELDMAPATRTRPRKPAAPRPNEAAPESTTPSTPEPDTSEEITEPVTSTLQGLTPPNFPPSNRMDDGSEFELAVLSDAEIEAGRSRKLSPLLGPDGVTTAAYIDENNNVLEAEDPFAMMDALAKIYPNAKFTGDGSLVLHRQKDKDGRIFELRANNSGKKAINYSMRWTDPETGQYKEYQHKDDRHAITALLRKDNGPQGLLDRLIGRVDNNGRDWGEISFGRGGPRDKFGPNDSLFKRLKWFMSGTGDRKKMEEIGDNAVRLAAGRNAVLHKDKRTIKTSDLPSLWDSFEDYISSGTSLKNRDVALKEDFYNILYSVFGSLPLNEQAHARARIAIRTEFARRFPEMGLRSNQTFQGLVTAASERMRGIYRTPDSKVRSIRYSSKDLTTPIETGMTVEYTNNVGEKSTLKVLTLVQNTNAAPGNLASYDYGDYVIVVDANGNKRKLNALKLSKLKNQNSQLTAYAPNLRGQALTDARRPLGGEAAVSIRPPMDLGRPIGSTSIVSAPPPPPRLVDDFIQGDMLYDKEGRPLGIIKTAPRPVTSRNGSSALAFLFTKPDGTEGSAIYKLGTEISPKKA